jgi:hypothetical protein
MAAWWCDVCHEQDELTPTTIAFYIQRGHDPDATPLYVRCNRHEGHAAVAAALMRSRQAPTAVSHRALRGASAQ